MSRPAISTGDVVRAWRALGAADDDERRAIARLLGFDLAAAGPIAPVSPPPAPPSEPRDPAAVRPAPPPVVDTAPSDADGTPIELVELPRSVDLSSEVLSAEALPRPPVTTAPPVAEALFAARWTRAITTGLVAREAAVGAVDLDAVLPAVYERRVVAVLPRLRRRVSSTRVVGVIDHAGALAWFADDAARLIAQIDAVSRAPMTRVPTDGAPRVVHDDRATAPDDLADDAPAAIRVEPGTRVLAISDLGVTAWGRGDRARTDAWVACAREVRAAGGSLVIVTPAPRALIPAALRRLAACVDWDATTRPAQVQRLVGALA